jgi:hypothetical protein
MKRLRDLPQFVGLHRTQIGELIKAGEFPKPVPLSDSGRAVAGLCTCSKSLWQIQAASESLSDSQRSRRDA